MSQKFIRINGGGKLLTFLIQVGMKSHCYSFKMPNRDYWSGLFFFFFKSVHLVTSFSYQRQQVQCWITFFLDFLSWISSSQTITTKQGNLSPDSKRTKVNQNILRSKIILKPLNFTINKNSVPTVQYPATI